MKLTSRLHDACAISFRLSKTIVMTSHNNVILRLRISQEKGAKTHGMQRKSNHGHTNQKFLIEAKSEKMAPKNKTKTGESQEKSASFTWSDEELELLLSVILHYKADKEGRGFDWQSVKTKYDDLRNLFLERYPKDGTSAVFPHDAERDFTKERVNSIIHLFVFYNV